MKELKKLSNLLREFSERNELWMLTKIYGIEAVEEHLLTENPNGLMAENFIFEKERQELVFWNFNKETFWVRSTYLVYTDKQATRDLPTAEYYIDVDVNGKFVNDNLVFCETTHI